MDDDRPWVSASDLAEYAYCPRSYWYGEHPPDPSLVHGDVRAERRGMRFHQQSLGAERSRDSHAGAYALLAVLGVGLLFGALYFGGLL